MNKPNQLIIIGGGSSVKEGIDKGLWAKLENKFTFGLNYSFNFFNSTAQVFVDDVFGHANYEKLRQLPLVLGLKQSRHYPDNTMLFNLAWKYDRSLKSGVYCPRLCGIFSLSLAIKVMQIGEIFLLGYDNGTNGKKDDKDRYVTHFYQGIIDHAGTGKIGTYNSIKHTENNYKPFVGVENINIYNVSLDSKIPDFNKISYDEFFNRLNEDKFDQNELRSYIRSQLSEVCAAKKSTPSSPK